MVAENLGLMTMFWCLLAFFTPVCLSGHLIRGRLYIRASENYNKSFLMPNRYLNRTALISKEQSMMRSWATGEHFDSSPQIVGDTRGYGCTGRFTGTQTPCYRNGTYMDCILDATPHRHEAFVRLGYALKGKARVRFSFWERNRMLPYGGLDERTSVQLDRYGRHSIQRNTYKHFYLRIIGCQTNICSFQEEETAILAYQAEYAPSRCC